MDMPLFVFSKLVRDKIVDHQIASGAKPIFRRLDSSRHKEELVNKIIEEAREVVGAPEADIASEIADVQQALDDLRELYGIPQAEVTRQQKKKNDKNGAFKKGYYIDTVETDEGNDWTAYYRKNADRYPEITP